MRAWGQTRFSDFIKLLPSHSALSRSGQDLGVLGTVQGMGRIGSLRSQTSTLIRFGEETHDEAFITWEAATRRVPVENTSREPLVSLRYFGPDTFPSVPNA